MDIKETRPIKQYNIERVKKYDWEHYGLYVIREPTPYKGHRYQPYTTYELRDVCDTIILKHATLRALGQHLDELGIYDQS